MRSILNRHSMVVLTALLIGALGLSACGTDDEDPATDTRTGADVVTVEHQFGTTEVEPAPERIVTLDVQWTDVMLAMGVEPVGYAVDPNMPESGVPWQDLPASAEALNMADGVPVEQIAELQPDLIVGTYSITDEAVYDQLAQIAPTIATLDAAQVEPWQDLVHTAGEVLADPEAADELVASVDEQVAAVADDLPGLRNKTFALAQYVVGDAIYIVADEADGSSVFFQQLGMTMYPPVRDHGEKTGQTRINVSTERSDLLRADFLAFLINGGDEADLADIAGFEQLPGTVAVLDYATIVGLNTPSPLSIPYALEQLLPYLEQAA
ncbi:ABC transporter substrate-binding protein [Haloactinopolyspora sp.]|uniref:ABC transporter substrate-binding protein n=1 Tax=Haloactinopolyspora sp. TaxID=1966353 RepID=UPI0026321727|nr:ABC transporter substrate-binding protein [Haloactinopolyspora sp.]